MERQNLSPRGVKIPALNVPCNAFKLQQTWKPVRDLKSFLIKEKKVSSFGEIFASTLFLASAKFSFAEKYFNLDSQNFHWNKSREKNLQDVELIIENKANVYHHPTAFNG